MGTTGEMGMVRGGGKRQTMVRRSVLDERREGRGSDGIAGREGGREWVRGRREAGRQSGKRAIGVER